MCLCSIPTPQKLIPEFYPLLKPGGQILVFEHVAAEYPPVRFIQTAYTVGGWRRLMDGCELDRPTQKYLMQSGKSSGRKGWKEVDLHTLPDEGWWSIVPHAVGRLVKAQ
jgi:ubiquinone/menaquinone biosynthesis C-methylase UbiE